MELKDYEKGETFVAKVLRNQIISSQQASDEVREIVLEVEQQSFGYEVGQSVGVVVPGIPEIDHPHHFRLYTVADTMKLGANGNPQVTLCVRRCKYVDNNNGEEHKGVASNFLCDREIGDAISLNGPFGNPFPVPEDKTADLLLIGMGTGIAPFRAFIRHIYHNVGDWKGRIRLFFGAKSGLELVYMNDEKNDFTQYYDEPTFEAIEALSPKGHWDNTGVNNNLEKVIEERGLDVLSILKRGNGYTYVAGLKGIEESLDRVFSNIIGSEEVWHDLKMSLEDQGRWIELTY
jgi:ferredoxin--NADP+ reductase